MPVRLTIGRAADRGEHDAVAHRRHHLHLIGRPTVGDDVDGDVDGLPRGRGADELHARVEHRSTGGHLDRGERDREGRAAVVPSVRAAQPRFDHEVRRARVGGVDLEAEEPLVERVHVKGTYSSPAK
jgi:hypothetical protein